MLELPHDFIDEENSGSSRKHTHRHVIEGQGGNSIFTDFDTFSLTENSLNLLLGSQRGAVFSLQSLGVKNIFCLVSNREIHQFAGGELVGHFDWELNLFIEKSRNIPDTVTDSPRNLRLQFKH